jgi:PASTA domain
VRVRRRGIQTAVGTLAFVLVAALSAGSAVAELPPYEGTMNFAPITGPSDPEDFSWLVNLGEGQELRAIDEQHAVVFDTESQKTAIGIAAAPAHDAIGTAVPTSLSVSGENVITLTVHHRAGNPAAGDAPFVYPVTVGEGWEGGFATSIAQMPPPEPLAREPLPDESRSCRVPQLKGKTLAAARRRLNGADCRMGKVSRLAGVSAKEGRVLKQVPRPGSLVPVGATVKVTLGTSSQVSMHLVSPRGSL